MADCIEMEWIGLDSVGLGRDRLDIEVEWREFGYAYRRMRGGIGGRLVWLLRWRCRALALLRLGG